jgi:hypothetical protein
MVLLGVNCVASTDNYWWPYLLWSCAMSGSHFVSSSITSTDNWFNLCEQRQKLFNTTSKHNWLTQFAGCIFPQSRKNGPGAITDTENLSLFPHECCGIVDRWQGRLFFTHLTLVFTRLCTTATNNIHCVQDSVWQHLGWTANFNTLLDSLGLGLRKVKPEPVQAEPKPGTSKPS